MHVLTVTSSQFGTKRLTYVRADTRELTVRFEEPAMLTVTVLGYAGSEYEGQIRLTVGPSSSSKYPVQLVAARYVPSSGCSARTVAPTIG